MIVKKGQSVEISEKYLFQELAMAQLIDLRMFFLLLLKGLTVWNPSLPAYQPITRLL
jgi:hypothetical protein